MFYALVNLLLEVSGLPVYRSINDQLINSNGKISVITFDLLIILV